MLSNPKIVFRLLLSTVDPANPKLFSRSSPFILLTLSSYTPPNTHEKSRDSPSTRHDTPLREQHIHIRILTTEVSSF
jgi:hypothetical protein